VFDNDAFGLRAPLVAPPMPTGVRRSRRTTFRPSRGDVDQLKTDA